MSPAKHALPLFVAVAGPFLVTGCAPQRTEEIVDRPNVLMIVVDTLRADHLGFYGYDRPTSPELDRFAESAVVFDAAQASAPWTLPGMASIFTSTYTSTHGCWGYGSRLDDSFTTLTEILTANGYDTACVVSHLFCTTRHGLQQGFVHIDDSFAHPETDPEKAITSQIISDKGIRFVQQKEASSDPHPWFLWLHYFDPHEKYMLHEGLSEQFVTPGKRTQARIDIDTYDGEIRYTDLHVGRVLDALAESRFAEDTIVVLVTDHGEEFLDHGSFGHGHTLFGELTRVPFAIRAPSVAPGRVEEVVRTVDLMPTLLDLLALPVPSQAVGRSLVPAMRGAPLDDAPALSELRQNPRRRIESIVSGRYKLIRYIDDDGRLALFDLEADPAERNDLAHTEKDVVVRMSKLLEDERNAANELGKRFENTPDDDLPPSVLESLGALGYVETEDDAQNDETDDQTHDAKQEDPR